MASYTYPHPQWVDESVKLYGEDFEKKLAKLSGNFAYKISSEPAWGINEDLYIIMSLENGKLKAFKHCPKDYAFQNADFILEATPQAWKRILTKKDKFVGAFMGGRVKLVKGDTVGALALGPHAGTLVDVLTQVELKFPDDLPAKELDAFKKDLASVRQERGI
ncbi:MAG: SCP2 sterol-binding domain-containing protein [Deltaproteobacteria bacterium]|nr:SCP2 sterol-binding domain-containing protein [Deltaproteobacteria bacterium]